MKLRKLFVLMILLLGSCLPMNSIAMDSYVVNQVTRATVSVQFYKMGQWYTVGSGTVVRSRTPFNFKDTAYKVITAGHVFEYTDGRMMRACSSVVHDSCGILRPHSHGESNNIEQDWATYDIAKLPKGVRPAAIRQASPKLGEEIFVVGYPWEQFFLARGNVAATYSKYGVDLFLVYGYTQPGGSGGGVFDKTGKLIGVVIARELGISPITFMPEMQENMVFVIPASRVSW